MLFNNYDSYNGDMWSKAHQGLVREGAPVLYYCPNQNPLVSGKTLVLAKKRYIVPNVSGLEINDDVIYELDSAGNLTGYQWRAADHIDQMGFDASARSEIASKGGEWLHANMLALCGPNKWYDAGDTRFHPNNIMVSFRSANLMIIIERSTGNIVWRVGPKYIGTTEGTKLGQIIGLGFLGETYSLRPLALFAGTVTELLVHGLHVTLPFLFRAERHPAAQERIRRINAIYRPICWGYGLNGRYEFVPLLLRLVNLVEHRLPGGREHAMALAGYAALFTVLERYTKSMAVHRRAFFMRKKLTDDWGVAESFKLMGYTCMFSGEFQRGYHYFSRGRCHFERLGDLFEVGEALWGMLLCAEVRWEINRMVKYADRYLDITSTLNDAKGISNAYMMKANMYIKQGAFADARMLAHMAHDLGIRDSIVIAQFEADLMLARLFIEQGAYQTAIDYATKARHVYEASVRLKTDNDIYNVLAEARIMEYRSKNRVPAERKKWYRLIDRESRRALKHTKRDILYYGNALRARAFFFGCFGPGVYCSARKKWEAAHRRSQEYQSNRNRPCFGHDRRYGDCDGQAAVVDQYRKRDAFFGH